MTLRLCTGAIMAGRMKSFLFMTTCGIAVAVASALLGLVYDLRIQMQRELSAFGPNLMIRPRLDGDGPGISKRQFLKVKEIIGALDGAVICPNLLGFVTMKGRESMVVRGVDFEAQERLSTHWEIDGTWARRDAEAMIGVQYARRTGLRAGKTLSLDIREDAHFRVRGIVRTGGDEDEQVLVSLRDAARILNTPWISSIQIRLRGSLARLEEISRRIESVLPGLAAAPVRRVAAAESRVLDRLESLIWIVNILILFMTGLTIMSISTALVSQRREEFALSRVLGSSIRHISILFYIQAVLTGLAASPAGFVIGYGALDYLAGALFSAEATFRWSLVPMIVFSMILVILAGAALAVKRIADIEPAVVLKGE